MSATYTHTAGYCEKEVINKIPPRDRSFPKGAMRSDRSTDDTCRGKRPFILLIMNYQIRLLLNSTILGLLTIKPFTISAINIVSHLLTSLNSATLNQFAVNP